MKVLDCMSRDARPIGPDDTIRSAAIAMARIDTGILPVGEGGRLAG